MESKAEGMHCSEDGCPYNPIRRFRVVKDHTIEREVFSCGMHDVKCYKELSSQYWPLGYKIIMENIGGKNGLNKQS